MESTGRESRPQRKPLNSNVAEFHPKQTLKPDVLSKRLGSLLGAIKELRASHEIKNDFPRLADYSSLSAIRETFPPLQSVNLEKVNSENCEFVSVVSNSLDDLHKAMKYGIWSTPDEAKIDWLSQLFYKNLRNDVRTILIFRLESGKFYGVAELFSGFLERCFDLWWDMIKLRGYFELNWLFVQTVSEKVISPLPQDFTAMNQTTGAYLLSLFQFKDFSFSQSIFSLFPLLDQREDYLLSARHITDVQIRLQKREYKQEKLSSSTSNIRCQKQKKPPIHSHRKSTFERARNKETTTRRESVGGELIHRSEPDDSDLMYIRKDS